MQWVMTAKCQVMIIHRWHKIYFKQVLSPAIYLNPRQQKGPSNVHLSHPAHLVVYQFKTQTLQQLLKSAQVAGKRCQILCVCVCEHAKKCRLPNIWKGGQSHHQRLYLVSVFFNVYFCKVYFWSVFLSVFLQSVFLRSVPSLWIF